jgi:hypothetical protein
MIDDGVSRDEVNPTLEFRGVVKLAQPFLNFHEDILQDVFSRRRVRHPRADELTQLLSKIMPDLFQSWIHQYSSGFHGLDVGRSDEVLCLATREPSADNFTALAFAHDPNLGKTCFMEHGL